MAVDFAVADLETDPFERGRYPAAFAGGFYDGKNMDVFWDPHIPPTGTPWFGKRVCKEVVDRCNRYGGTVYLHNGGKFDLHHLLDFLPRRDLKVLPIASRLVEIKTPRVTFRDSYAIVPKPLKSWGKKDISYALLERDKREANKREILEYLKEDLRQLYEMLSEFFNRFGKNITLASTAFSVLKKQFKVKLPKTNEFFDERFRPFYFGGRVQFFSLGEHIGDYQILDINSAYPWAITKKHWFDPGFETLRSVPKRFPELCFYEVKCNPGGALPRREKDGSICFPHEHGHYKCCGWELIEGLRTKCIRNLEVLKVYRPKNPRDLSDFAYYFYNEKNNAKQSGDKSTEYFSKIILNAPTGKFALNPREFKDVSIRPYRSCPCGKNHVRGPACLEGWEISWDDEQRGITFYQRKTHDIMRPEPGPEMRFYNVCTSASITSCVRAHLHESMRNCDKVLYCDTDSIIGSGTAGLHIGDGLGKWKLEMRCDVVWIAGKKLYAAHDRFKPFRKNRPALRHWFKVKGHGWAYQNESDRSDPANMFKIASKGVNLRVKDIIAVALGEERESIFDAPTYSVYSPPRFITRRINRADRQEKAGNPAKLR
jgi:hypothetical protein